ncbi:MAG: hypothetical protein ACKVX7_10735 [Planctomycetota bacterium]
MIEEPMFAPGFRLSALDVVVLGIGAFAALGLATVNGSFGLVVEFVLAHFFLFCNVVRMARTLELVWAGIFMALAGATVLFETPGWPATVSISLAATAVLVVVEMRKPSYHGLCWQRINPELPKRWKARQAGHRD